MELDNDEEETVSEVEGQLEWPGSGVAPLDWLMNNSLYIHCGAGFTLATMAVVVLLRLLWKLDTTKPVVSDLPKFIILIIGATLSDTGTKLGLLSIEMALFIFTVLVFMAEFYDINPLKMNRRFAFILLLCGFSLQYLCKTEFSSRVNYASNAAWWYGKCLEFMIYSQLVSINRKRKLDRSIYYFWIASAIIKLVAFLPYSYRFHNYTPCPIWYYYCREEYLSVMENRETVCLFASMMVHLYWRRQPAWHNTEEEDEAEERKAEIGAAKKNEEKTETDDEVERVNVDEQEIIEDNDENVNEARQRRKATNHDGNEADADVDVDTKESMLLRSKIKVEMGDDEDVSGARQRRKGTNHDENEIEADADVDEQEIAEMGYNEDVSGAR